jgi:pyruvate formate lyase activating enzyme
MLTGTIFDIKRYALHDGPGIRVTVFLKGCPLRCPWCHNPESLAVKPQRVRRRRVAPGEGEHWETVGREVSVEDVMREVDKDTVFMDESGGGVTFSGGEPLMQPDFLLGLLEACRARSLHTLLDTSGHAPAEVFDRVAEAVNLFYYDLKLMDDAEHRKHTGQGNERILRNLRRLVETNVSTVIRFVVIPGITDTRRNIDALADTLSGLGVDRIDLLPYHELGVDKYKWVGIDRPMDGLRPPSDQEMESLYEHFQSRGLRPRINR